MKKGICKNIGPCTKANSEEKQEIIDDFAPFECSECGQLLTEVIDDKPKPKIPKWLLPIAGGIILLGLLAIFILPMLMTKSSNTIVKKEEVQNIPKEIINTPIDNKEKASIKIVDKSKQAEEKTENKKIEPNINELTANSLEDGLQKIGNTSYDRSIRKNLIPKVLVQFENSTVPVKVLRNNEEYEIFKVSQYLDRILIQGIQNISVVKQVKNNSGLINELTVNER